MPKSTIRILGLASVIYLICGGTCNALTDDTTIEDLLESNMPKIGGITIGNSYSASEITKQYKFGWSQGHGFAAERANNLIDRIQGKNAIILGDNNAINGPDRRIISSARKVTDIQTKYYKTARESFNAFFDNGKIRYYQTTNKPQVLEVPADQYDDVCRMMENSIRKGEIPGVRNPADAKKLVKKGHLTYEQAVNVSKTGTFEGLVYDARTGAVSAMASGGISALITFGLCKTQGMSTGDALGLMVENGLTAGTISFVNHMVQAQLSRTPKYYARLGIEHTKNMFSEDVAKRLLMATEDELAIKEMGKQRIRHTAVRKVMSDGVAAGITLAVLSVKDLVVVFSGKMSGEQFAKNFIENCGALIGGIAGAEAGAFVGSFGGPVGSKIGGAIGGVVGTAGGYVAGKVGAEEIFGLEDDAQKMYEILKSRFSVLGNQYILNENDANKAFQELKVKLTQDNLILLYKSKDRVAFADGLIEPIMQRILADKPKVKPLTELEIRKEMRTRLGKTLLVH